MAREFGEDGLGEGRVSMALFRYPDLWDTPELKKIYAIWKKMEGDSAQPNEVWEAFNRLHAAFGGKR